MLDTIRGSWRALTAPRTGSREMGAHRTISLLAGQTLYARDLEPLCYVPHWRPKNVEEVSPRERYCSSQGSKWRSGQREAMKIEYV
jgi:hypothetical protein